MDVFPDLMRANCFGEAFASFEESLQRACREERTRLAALFEDGLADARLLISKTGATPIPFEFTIKPTDPKDEGVSYRAYSNNRLAKCRIFEETIRKKLSAELLERFPKMEGITRTFHMNSEGTEWVPVSAEGGSHHKYRVHLNVIDFEGL